MTGTICGHCLAHLEPDPRVAELQAENTRLREQLHDLLYHHSANSNAAPLPPRCAEVTPPPP